MPTPLPNEAVLVVEGVVREDLGAGVRAERCCPTQASIRAAIVNALLSEAHIGLRTERNADFGITSKPENSGRIARYAVTPVHPREAFTTDGENVCTQLAPATLLG